MCLCPRCKPDKMLTFFSTSENVGYSNSAEILLFANKFIMQYNLAENVILKYRMIYLDWILCAQI